MRFKFASTSKRAFNKVISNAYLPLGNYGNMMDESTAPSNTPPCNAVYDGCNYYYLPWSEDSYQTELNPGQQYSSMLLDSCAICLQLVPGHGRSSGTRRT